MKNLVDIVRIYIRTLVTVLFTTAMFSSALYAESGIDEKPIEKFKEVEIGDNVEYSDNNFIASSEVSNKIVDMVTVSAVSTSVEDYIPQIQLRNFEERSIPIEDEIEESIESTETKKEASSKDASVSSMEYIKSSQYYADYVYPLAKIIFAEGGIMGDDFQKNVGYVVMNRVKSKYFPSTLMGVFLTGDSYAETSRTSFWNEQVSDQTIRNAYEVVNEYFAGTMNCSPAMVYQAEFRQGSNIFQIGNTYFGCDERILRDLENV